MKLSPAVVSKRISLLEDRLGARLFQRTTRQLTLTDTGEGFFKRVVDILNLVEEAEDFVSRRNTSPKGVLKVTAPTSFGRLHVAPYIPQFCEQYPEIELDIQVTDNFVDIIRDGYDMAIRIGELKDSTMVARKLAPNDSVICAAPQYLEVHGEPKSLKELSYHNCLSSGQNEQWKLEGPDGATTFRAKGSVRTNSSEFARELILSGHGIGLRSTWDIGDELKSGKLRVILPTYKGSSNMGIYAVYPCRDFMPAKVNAFIEFLFGLYGSEPYWNEGLMVA